MSSIHSVKREQHHLAWDNSIPPVLTVDSGAVVDFDCLDASNGQITPASTAVDLAALAVDTLDQVNGPIFVRGATPGSVLRVDVLAAAPAAWGWTGIIPGFGLLADEFTTPALKIWELDAEAGYAWFDKEKGIRIPLRPFCGEMGLARAAPGKHSTIPPYRTGGNIDTRHVTVGSSLFLPIEVEGALFSIGDGHAAQGDGEVCGTAIETPMRVSVRLTVLTGPEHAHVQSPHFLTSSASPHPSSSSSTETYYTTTGVEPALLPAAQAATRAMLAALAAQHALSAADAYMLCSVAGDLRLHEVVDMPNFVVGMMMPQSIFGHAAA